MKKKTIICIVIILVFILLIIIAKTTSSKELELTLKTNGGVPYKWEYKIEDESIVKFIKTKEITSKKDKELAGGPVYIKYIFKGLKEGKTTITFKYVNIIDNSIKKKDRVIVKVDKYKNISIIEKQ